MLLVANIKDIPGAGANFFYRIDAMDDAIAFRWRPTTATAVKKVDFIQNNASGSPGTNLSCVLTGDSGCAPIVSSGVPVDIGGGSPTLVNNVAPGTGTSTRFQAIFTNAFTPTVGTLYWVVLYPTAGNTHDATNWRQLMSGSQHMSGARGVEMCAHGSALSTSPVWSRQTMGVPCVSFLDASDNYLTTITSGAMFGFTTIWHTLSTNDEIGVAMDIPSDVRINLYGFNSVYKPLNSDADVHLKIYKDSTQIGTTQVIDVSEWLPVYNTNTVATTFWLSDGPYTVDGPGTLRIMILATHASASFTMPYLDFALQGRHDAMLLARDLWYSSRNEGGAFTDDKTLLPIVHPYIEHVAPASGGKGRQGLHAIEAGAA